jgi:hypothetical protein
MFEELGRDVVAHPLSDGHDFIKAVEVVCLVEVVVCGVPALVSFEGVC